MKTLLTSPGFWSTIFIVAAVIIAVIVGTVLFTSKTVVSRICFVSLWLTALFVLGIATPMGRYLKGFLSSVLSVLLIAFIFY